MTENRKHWTIYQPPHQTPLMVVDGPSLPTGHSAELVEASEYQRLREGIEAEVEHQEAIALSAETEAMHLGSHGNLDGEREANLVAAIANNTLRKLRPLLPTQQQEGSDS